MYQKFSILIGIDSKQKTPQLYIETIKFAETNLTLISLKFVISINS
jgi:hypothetical protein